MRRLKPLPAHPWTVAAYARWCETRHRHPVIVQRVRAIARAHLLACVPPPDRHPLVLRTLSLIEQRSRTRTQRGALFPADAAATPVLPALAPAEPLAAGGRQRRTMRATPRLVARRPPGRGV